MSQQGGGGGGTYNCAEQQERVLYAWLGFTTRGCTSWLIEQNGGGGFIIELINRVMYGTAWLSCTMMGGGILHGSLNNMGVVYGSVSTIGGGGDTAHAAWLS